MHIHSCSWLVAPLEHRPMASWHSHQPTINSTFSNPHSVPANIFWIWSFLECFFSFRLFIFCQMLPTNNSPQNAFNLANPPTLPLSSSNGIFAIPSLTIPPFQIPIISSFLHLPTFSSIFRQFPILTASERPKIDDPPPVLIDESKNSSNLKSEEGNLIIFS